MSRKRKSKSVRYCGYCYDTNRSSLGQKQKIAIADIEGCPACKRCLAKLSGPGVSIIPYVKSS